LHLSEVVPKDGGAGEEVAISGYGPNRNPLTPRLNGEVTHGHGPDLRDRR
jgi:hypothetical protein